MSHSYPSDISREQFVRILPTLFCRTKPRTLYDVFCGVYLLKACHLPADFEVFPAMERAAWPGPAEHLKKIVSERAASVSWTAGGATQEGVGNQASYRGGHARIAPCDTRDYRRRHRPGRGFGDV